MEEYGKMLEGAIPPKDYPKTNQKIGLITGFTLGVVVALTLVKAFDSK